MELLRLNIQMFADGKVVIDTDLNKKGFESGLSKMQSIAKTGFKAIATSVGIASTAIAGLIGKAVTMAGDLEQQMGGTEAVFGDFAETVQKKAAGAFDQMGLSANDFMATANKMGALMQGSGLSIEESMNLYTQAMQRAADVASIMGIDVGMAMESVAGAAKGNFTMMDNLGVAMNATTIEAYALSKGIEQSYNEMDNATKVGLAMEMFLEKTSYAAGNYAKENKTFAGSFNTLKAATSNFLSGAGGIEDVASSLVSFGEILVESIGNMAPTIVEGLITLTQNLLPQIPILLESLMPAVLEGAVSLINGLVAIFPALMTMIQENLPTIIKGGMTIIKTLLTTILNMLPQILQMGITLLLELVKGITESLPEIIPAMIDAIVLMVETLLDNIDLIIDAGIELILALAEGLIDALPDLIDKIPTIIEKMLTAITTNLPKLLEMGIKLLLELALGLIKAIPKLISKIPQIISAIVTALGEGLKSMLEVGKNLVSGLWDGIKNSFTWIKNKIKGWVGDVMSFIKKLFGIHSPSTVMRDEVGKYLAQGLGVGFDKELDSVYNDMQRAIDLETGKMSANVQASGTYQMAMAGMPTFNLLDNSEHSTQLVVNGKVLAEVVNTENRNREVATS
jgi:phage-related protein